MAYENGKQMNRYAAMLKHKDKLKRRHAPRQYSSFNSYVNYKEQELEELVEQYNTEWLKRRALRLNGYKNYFEKYWDNFNEPWRRDLKRRSHRNTRNYYRDTLSDFKNYNFDYDDEEVDFDILLFTDDDDIWFYD